MDESSPPLDELDRILIGALVRNARAGTTELARLAGVSRSTVYARLDRLERTGAIMGYGPDVDPARAGYGVTAFCNLEISQHSHHPVTSGLAAIAEVVEIHTITGPGDLLCRVVARSNDHLHQVLQQITGLDGVIRSQTQLALHTSHRRSVAALVAGVASG
ncbi:MAG: Lrp/AsnC family transcriptional regulator [Actinomycetota bacterium]